MTAHERWAGKYTHSTEEPELLGRVIASSFRVACWLYELQSTIHGIQSLMEKDIEPDDEHFGKWYYDPITNSNFWTGKYYQTKEEAQKSFT
jgi:hypothetical protein